MKVGEMGVIGLMGGRSGMFVCMSGRMKLAQSCSVDSSSPGAGRNQRVDGDVSLVLVRPTVRLERRLRNLSVAGSGEMLMIRVGKAGPCFR